MRTDLRNALYDLGVTQVAMDCMAEKMSCVPQCASPDTVAVFLAFVIVQERMRAVLEELQQTLLSGWTGGEALGVFDNRFADAFQELLMTLEDAS